MRELFGLWGAGSRRRGRLQWLLRSSIVLAFAAAPAPALAAGTSNPVTALLSNDTPAPVLAGTAAAISQLPAATGLDLNVGLAVRNSSKLDALIAAASNPASPSYGHYLTQAQYMAQYAPTDAQASAATAWLKARGLDVTGVSADNLLIGVHATAAQAERVFDVTLKNFRADGRTFRANDRAPRVPADLDISAVSGLSNFVVYKPAITCTPAPKCGYDGTDFRSAYDVVGDGTGQTLGFTLWGESLPQSDYNGYATATGTTALNVGGSGDDGLNFIPVGGTSTVNEDGEVALDTEIAHGVAPGIHETYWLGHDSGAIMETVLADAAASSISIISNSWGAQSSGCPTDTNMETALQAGAATGKTFYFATGDSGAASGCSYPATSQYAVAVGGTNLASITNETALANGGGCSNAEPRPSWQTGIGTPLTSPGGSNCTGRATPDVSADSGIGTYLYLDGSPSCCTGGTSLATPIWAAATVIYNKHNAASGRPGVGFDAPLIYQLANNPTTYPHDFHDITQGTNGFAAVTGWDEATGWGSPNFDKLFNNPTTVTYTGPTSANQGATITLSATLVEAGSTTPLVNSPVTFAAAAETCNATTDGSGHASCSVTLNNALDVPGHYSAIAVFAGDAVHVADSDTEPFTINNIPTTTTYTGPTSGTYGVPVTLTATLTDNSNSLGIGGETIHIAFGAESCNGVTNGSGQMSCTVTPLDSPGGSPYPITASFAGDAPTYLSSSDTSKSFTVNKAPTTTTLAVAPASPSVFGQSVTFTATVTPSDNGGSVKFLDGATPITGCSAQPVTGASHQATCTTTALSVAAHTISAVYSGDGNYLSSTSSNLPYTVNKAPTTTTLAVAPASPSVFGQSVTFTATVTPNDNGGSVKFLDGATPITGCSAQPVTGGSHQSTCTTAALSVGNHTISAVYSGDGNYLSSTSSNLPYTVNKAMTTTTLSASPAGGSTFGQSVTFTALVAPVPPGAGLPTGTVAFTVDGTAVGSSTVSGTSQASLATSSLSAGTHTIGATYSGDGNFFGSSGSLSYLVTCTVNVSGTHSGALEVTSSTCVAPGTVITGAIDVHAGGALDVESATVNGGLNESATASVIRVCKSSIGGSVDIKSDTALVIFGDPGDASCQPNTVAGTLLLQNNTGGVEAINNTEHGLTATGNSGPGPFPGDPTTITGNHS
jgi:uncharacterized protein (DUF2237 family)